jgi:hypothetical protein
MGNDNRWTHDLRRSFASRCGDLGTRRNVAKLLNHSILGAGSLPVYLRSEWAGSASKPRRAGRAVATVLA